MGCLYVFREQQVAVGPDKICFEERIRIQSTHTLLIAFHSFVYRLFDPSGVNFTSISPRLEEHLSPAAKEARDMVVEVERAIHGDLAKIRCNIGFHHGDKRKQQRAGYGAYETLHPLAPMLIMQGLRVFFRQTHKVFDSSEEYGVAHEDEVTAELLEVCRDLKRQVDEQGGGSIAALLQGLREELAGRGDEPS
jgi:hypothetical protein